MLQMWTVVLRDTVVKALIQVHLSTNLETPTQSSPVHAELFIFKHNLASMALHLLGSVRI